MAKRMKTKPVKQADAKRWGCASCEHGHKTRAGNQRCNTTPVIPGNRWGCYRYSRREPGDQ